MKHLRKILVCVVIIAAMLVPSFAFADKEPILSFTVVSDLHLDELLFQTLDSNLNQFRKILADAEATGHDDIFICGGDMSSYGNSLVWYLTKSMVDKTGFDRTIYALGNHEYGILGTHLFTRYKFMQFNGEDSIYFTKQIEAGDKKYNIICLGVEEGIPGTLGSYSKKQLCWFKNELEKAKEAGTPIFVISHYGEISGNMETELSKIIGEVNPSVPVIFMWGHEHGFEYLSYGYDDLFGGGDGYTTARMGSTHYYFNNKSDALYVDVYSDKVVLDLHRVTGKELDNMPVTIEFK